MRCLNLVYFLEHHLCKSIFFIFLVWGGGVSIIYKSSLGIQNLFCFNYLLQKNFSLIRYVKRGFIFNIYTFTIERKPYIFVIEYIYSLYIPYIFVIEFLSLEFSAIFLLASRIPCQFIRPKK